MSGFERSAPIPGSQGPRRSTMQRINNAPPPMTPWRKEVLEAQRQAAEAAKRSGERSKSRSRSRQRRDKERTERGNLGPPNRRKEEDASQGATPVMKDALLRQAKERGEGWYAAIARSSEAWTGPAQPTPPKVPGVPGLVQVDARKEKDKPKDIQKEREKEKDKRKEKDKEKVDKSRPEKTVAPIAPDAEPRSEKTKEEELLELQAEKEEMEKKWRADFEAREKRLCEERKKAEEERRKRDQMEKSRKAKLGNCFAVDGDVDEEPSRETRFIKKSADRKRVDGAEGVRGQQANSALGDLEAASSLQVALPGAPTGAAGADLGKKLGFDGCQDPAEAFMRLQERKRKGRRAEFGGPPRGCSPWRDGKRGVTFAKERIRPEGAGP